MPRTLKIVFQSFQISDFSRGGGHAPDPPSKRGFEAPCQYRRVLFSNWLPTSNFIETPDWTVQKWVFHVKNLVHDRRTDI